MRLETHYPCFGEVERKAKLSPHCIFELYWISFLFTYFFRFSLSLIPHDCFLFECFLIFLLGLFVFPHPHRHEPPWLNGKLPYNGKDDATIRCNKIIVSLFDLISNGANAGTSLLNQFFKALTSRLVLG